MKRSREISTFISGVQVRVLQPGPNHWLLLLVLCGTWYDMLSLPPLMVLLPRVGLFTTPAMAQLSAEPVCWPVCWVAGVGGDARRASPVLPS